MKDCSLETRVTCITFQFSTWFQQYWGKTIFKFHIKRSSDYIEWEMVFASCAGSGIGRAILQETKLNSTNTGRLEKDVPIWIVWPELQSLCRALVLDKLSKTTVNRLGNVRTPRTPKPYDEELQKRSPISEFVTITQVKA